MKKVLFLSLVFGGLALTSCKKDYTCECKKNLGGMSWAYTFDINDAKKKDAEAECTYNKVPGVPDVNMDCSVYEAYQ